MATVRYFWHGFIHKGTTFMYLHYCRPLYLSPFAKCLQRVVHDQRVHLCWYSVLDRPTARISSSLVLHRFPRSSPFTLPKRSLIAWTHIGWVRRMFQNLPFPAAQEVRDSSGVDSLHSKEKWRGSMPPSVVVFSWVFRKTDYFNLKIRHNK